ncbi:hypothetical protein AK830_g2657 [Neonectria ditissima]|uniref:Histidine kinase group protein n=1 Tax=Neonectria ditissima TaxID=78410 RepID=A0A0P7BR10_9HYPO|nr:hypothetical protein AK830_g2657 [Neonectria ditissima]
MTNRKSKLAAGAKEQAAAGGSSSTSSPAPVPSGKGPRKGPGGAKQVSGPPAPVPTTIAISRNKHWRYISYFHGPWLQMPLEILETIANINYNTPRPRPIDPAVFFDVLKIRRLVDSATNLAVRAASDLASPILTNVHDSLPDGTGSSLVVQPGTSGYGVKLSRERKFRMREQASQKLGQAYRLDEIACSVAAMQGASALEEIGAQVLLRNPDDVDAKYVQFFHEKIPSRQLAEPTSLLPLADIISERPEDVEALRTRAMVKTFMNDYEGAAHDLTLALSACRFHQPPQKPAAEPAQLQQTRRTNRRPQDVVLAEKDQPSSLEGQLEFQRASAYITLACQHIPGGLPPALDLDGNTATETAFKGPAPTPTGPSSLPQDKETERRQAESRKLVKVFAKRALRDYMAFIARFDYAPNLPLRVAKDFNDRVNLAGHGTRNPRSCDGGPPIPAYSIYSLSDLFAPVPPPDLSPWPREDLPEASAAPQPLEPTCEFVTYHPLLTDALHSILLCHCLVQTSSKEHLRHANMVARLTRLADGYPVFQPGRSSARTDWAEILSRASNWLELSNIWEVLCTPAPLPIYDFPNQRPISGQAAASAAALVNKGPPVEKLPKEPHQEPRQEQHQQQRKEQTYRPPTLEDVPDEDECAHGSTNLFDEVLAPEKRAEGDGKLFDANNVSVASDNGDSAVPGMAGGYPTIKRFNVDDKKEYSFLSARAIAIARWVREAPVVTGTAKRKKRTKKPGKAEAGLDNALETLHLKGDEA